MAKEESTVYSIVVFVFYIYCILVLIFRAQYYNNPIEEFDCLIENIKIEEINSDWRITADIIDIATNDTFNSRLACWDSQDCDDIINEYFTDEQTVCAKRRVTGLFTRQKGNITPLNIPYYTGDVITNVLMWIFISCYSLGILILCVLLIDEVSTEKPKPKPKINTVEQFEAYLANQ